MEPMRALLGAVVAMGIAALAGPAGATNPAGQGAIEDQPESILNTCFWGLPVRKDTRNILGVDTHVAYYFARYRPPEGAHLVLNGEFPHARFISFSAYKTVEGQRGFANMDLIDTQIDPDPGSGNPFRSDGTMRVVHNRSYTITLDPGLDPGPGNRAPNTLYTGQTELSDGFVELAYRIYRMDKNHDIAGGVPLPEVTLVREDQSTVSGEPACAEIQSSGGAGNAPLVGVPLPFYQSLLALGGPTHPAFDPPLWFRFFNQERILEPFWTGTSEAWKIPFLSSEILPGFFPTPANAYVYAFADRRNGPDPDGHNILVLRGRMPTHPETYLRNPHNEYGGKEVRYWSLCNYGSIVIDNPLPVNSDCVFDEQVPTDEDGYYTIVISLPEDRPWNAVDHCGVAWMDWGTEGDWFGRPELIDLTLRNQLADPSFAEGVDKVLVPGDEKAVMGDFLPDGTYMSKQQFEDLGCD